MRSLWWITALCAACALAPQLPYGPWHIEPGVNAVLGDRSWDPELGPAATADPAARIERHLQYVEQRLRAQRASGLSVGQATRRAGLLDALADYRRAGVFPINDRFDERPRIRDAAGRLCAVAQLVAVSGANRLLERLATLHEWDYVSSIDEPELAAWATDHGMSLRELAMIQPAYRIYERDRSIDVPTPTTPRPSVLALQRSFAKLQPDVEHCRSQLQAGPASLLVSLHVVWPATDPVQFAASARPANPQLEDCVAAAARVHWRRTFAMSPGREPRAFTVRFWVGGPARTSARRVPGSTRSRA